MVDFELATGLEMRHPKYGSKTPWNIKSEMFNKLYKHLTTVYTKFAAIPSKKKIRPLTSFGATKWDIGLTIRCKLMTNQNAEIAVIQNIIQFLQEGTAGNNPTNKTGSLNHILSYKHIPHRPVMTLETTKQFSDKMTALIAARARKPKYRLRYKQPPRLHR